MAIWYKTYAALKDHPKVLMFSGEIGASSEIEGLGYLHLFFSAICAYAEDGGIEKIPIPVLEKMCKWGGPPGNFMKALEKSGFVDNTPEGRIVHDWWEINGHQVKEHARKEKARTKRGPSADEAQNDRVTDRQTDRQTDNQDHHHTRERLDEARSRFIALRAEHPTYKGKPGYVWSERDRKAVNAALYPDRLNGHYPSREDVEYGLANFFASDTKWTADHCAFYFFERFSQFIAGPAVDRGRQSVGGKDAKNGRQSRLSGFGADKKITGKGRGVKDIRWDDSSVHDGPTGGGETTTSSAGGNNAKV